jgi:hypothetical protein
MYCRPTESYPETGFGEIHGGFLDADFWTIFRGGGLAEIGFWSGLFMAWRFINAYLRQLRCATTSE